MVLINELINGKSGFTYFWKIQNFPCDFLSQNSFTKQISKNNCVDSLQSPTFESGILLNRSWHVTLEFQKNGSVILVLSKDRGSTIKINIEIYLVDAGFDCSLIYDSDNQLFKLNGDTISTPISAEDLCTNLIIAVHLYQDYLTTDSSKCSLLSIYDNGKLYSLQLDVDEDLDFIGKEFNIYQSNFVQKTKIETTSKSTQTDKIEDSNIFEDLDDLLKLFKEKKFRYVTLRAEDKDFAAYKAILSARSPVFNAMFNNDMKENDSNTIFIDDIDSSTISRLLQFLHLEPLPDLEWDEAAKLYYAADKYQVEALKTECALFLKQKLSVDNICEAFVLADMHKDTELRNSALEYFGKNAKLILRSKKWKDLLLSKTEFAADVLSESAKRM